MTHPQAETCTKLPQQADHPLLKLTSSHMRTSPSLRNSTAPPEIPSPTERLIRPIPTAINRNCKAYLLDQNCLFQLPIDFLLRPRLIAVLRKPSLKMAVDNRVYLSISSQLCIGRNRCTSAEQTIHRSCIIPVSNSAFGRRPQARSQRPGEVFRSHDIYWVSVI